MASKKRSLEVEESMESDASIDPELASKKRSLEVEESMESQQLNF